MKSEPGEVCAETSFGCSDPEVGHQRQSESAADGGTLHGSHDGKSRPEEPHTSGIQLSRIFVVGPVCKVGTSAEVFSFATQNDGTGLAASVERFEGIGDLFDEPHREEVVRRPMDLNRRDMILADVYRYVSHNTPRSLAQGLRLLRSQKLMR